MAIHAKDALGCPGIAQVFNLPLAVSAFKTIGTKCLVSGENCQIFDLVSAVAAAVGTIVANERAIAEEKEVCVGIEERAASIAPETVDVPSVICFSSVSRLLLFKEFHFHT